MGPPITTSYESDGDDDYAFAQAAEITRLGDEIVRLFVELSEPECADSLGLESAAKVQQKAQRFELWANNLGLGRRDHAALEYRLRDAPLVAAFTANLLNSLKSALESVKEDALGMIPTPEFDDLPSDFSEDELEGLKSFADTTVTEVALGNIENSLKRLFRLAFKIRNPRLRHGFTKAKTFTQKDRETGVELMTQYYKFDRDHIRQLLRRDEWADQIREVPRSSEPSKEDNPPNEPKSDHFLLERLTEANALRRKQFKHWQRHRRKMQGDRPVQSRTKAPAVDEKASVDDMLTQSAAQEEALEIPLSELPPTISNPTTATRLDPVRIDLKDDNSTVFSSYSTISIERNANSLKVQIPSPPTLLEEEGDEFECPYCFILCSQKVLRPDNWRKHILRDLRPYICTYENCNDSDQLYDSYKDWQIHEAIHYDATKPRVRSCPVCNQPDASDAHIGSELQRIAVFSLPRSHQHDEESAEGSTDSVRMAVGNGSVRTDASGVAADDDSDSHTTASESDRRSEGTDAFQRDEREPEAPSPFAQLSDDQKSRVRRFIPHLGSRWSEYPDDSSGADPPLYLAAAAVENYVRSILDDLIMESGSSTTPIPVAEAIVAANHAHAMLSTVGQDLDNTGQADAHSEDDSSAEHIAVTTAEDSLGDNNISGNPDQVNVDNCAYFIYAISQVASMASELPDIDIDRAVSEVQRNWQLLGNQRKEWISLARKMDTNEIARLKDPNSLISPVPVDWNSDGTLPRIPDYCRNWGDAMMWMMKEIDMGRATLADFTTMICRKAKIDVRYTSGTVLPGIAKIREGSNMDEPFRGADGPPTASEQDYRTIKDRFQGEIADLRSCFGDQRSALLRSNDAGVPLAPQDVEMVTIGNLKGILSELESTRSLKAKIESARNESKMRFVGMDFLLHDVCSLESEITKLLDDFGWNEGSLHGSDANLTRDEYPHKAVVMIATIPVLGIGYLDAAQGEVISVSKLSARRSKYWKCKNKQGNKGYMPREILFPLDDSRHLRSPPACVIAATAKNTCQPILPGGIAVATGEALRVFESLHLENTFRVCQNSHGDVGLVKREDIDFEARWQGESVETPHESSGIDKFGETPPPLVKRPNQILAKGNKFTAKILESQTGTINLERDQVVNTRGENLPSYPDHWLCEYFPQRWGLVRQDNLIKLKEIHGTRLVDEFEEKALASIIAPSVFSAHDSKIIDIQNTDSQEASLNEDDTRESAVIDDLLGPRNQDRSGHSVASDIKAEEGQAADSFESGNEISCDRYTVVMQVLAEPANTGFGKSAVRQGQRIWIHEDLFRQVKPNLAYRTEVGGYGQLPRRCVRPLSDQLYPHLVRAMQDYEADPDNPNQLSFYHWEYLLVQDLSLHPCYAKRGNGETGFVSRSSVFPVLKDPHDGENNLLDPRNARDDPLTAAHSSLVYSSEAARVLDHSPTTDKFHDKSQVMSHVPSKSKENPLENLDLTRGIKSLVKDPWYKKEELKTEDADFRYLARITKRHRPFPWASNEISVHQGVNVMTSERDRGIKMWPVRTMERKVGLVPNEKILLIYSENSKD